MTDGPWDGDALEFTGADEAPISRWAARLLNEETKNLIGPCLCPRWALTVWRTFGEREANLRDYGINVIFEPLMRGPRVHRQAASALCSMWPTVMIGPSLGQTTPTMKTLARSLKELAFKAERDILKARHAEKPVPMKRDDG